MLFEQTAKQLENMYPSARSPISSPLNGINVHTRKSPHQYPQSHYSTKNRTARIRMSDWCRPGVFFGAM